MTSYESRIQEPCTSIVAAQKHMIKASRMKVIIVTFLFMSGAFPAGRTRVQKLPLFSHIWHQVCLNIFSNGVWENETGVWENETGVRPPILRFTVDTLARSARRGYPLLCYRAPWLGLRPFADSSPHFVPLAPHLSATLNHQQPTSPARILQHPSCDHFCICNQSVTSNCNHNLRIARSEA